MCTVDMHEAPPYIALSYTWGALDVHEMIRIDDRCVFVPQNLADALRTIRSDWTDDSHSFWADSACINQLDMHERGHQVRFMHAIYRCAEYVAIWLGNDADNSELAMDTMATWKVEWDKLMEITGEDHWISALTTHSATLASFDNAEQRDAWEAFRSLLLRDWWSRAWIVQEATALSADSTLLYCGDRVVRWPTLRVALHLGHQIALRQTETTSLSFDSMAPIRLDQFRVDCEAGTFGRLFTALALLRTFECRDPRDKLYAALGLAADVSAEDIIPDYTKSVEEVYHDIVNFTDTQCPQTAWIS